MNMKTLCRYLLAGILFFLGFSLVDAGSITGEAKYIGNTPKLPVVRVTKDQDYCGETLPNDVYLSAPNGGLKNVVVSIEAAPSNVVDSQKLNLLENTGCRYVPRILAMQKGERLKVSNNDLKLHIPHSYLGEKTVFILSLPFRGTTLEATRRIRQPGILKVVCDTHAWMLAYVHVFEHPFFAVSDERGMFSIKNVPPGTYVLKAWHEDAGTRSQQVTVSEAGEGRVVFEFTKR